MIVPNPLRPMEAIHSGLFQQLLKWLDNRLSSLHAVSSDISGKTGRLPNSISATWGASCRWPTTLPTAHSAPTAFSGGFLRGHLAHLAHAALYRMHQMDLYGPVRGGVTWFADDLYRAVRPRIHLG